MPVQGGDGFVTLLTRYLDFHFKQRTPRPVVWRDKGQIRPSDHFDNVIEEGLKASDVLLIVMSDNWLASEYCRKELELFKPKALARGERNSPIIVAAKHEVRFEARDEMLRKQVGYKFFDENDVDKPEFFRTHRYDAIENVASSMADDIRARILSADPTSRREDAKPPESRKRRVYLAKPAGDMTAAYDRLAEELERREYAVQPSRDSHIPLTSTVDAVNFVDEALQDAEISIHLLGERPGSATDDVEQTTIVRLQLDRAGIRAQSDPQFRRLIWAPRILGSLERDPFATVARFGERRDNDTIEGAEETVFSEFVTQHLKDRKAASGPIETIKEGSSVYVFHREEDVDYAIGVGDALKQRNVQPVFPIFADTDEENRNWHEQQLRECDAVVVCWANAGEVWLRQQLPAFKDWTIYGRPKAFTCRGVIAGPPGEKKQSFIKLFKRHLLKPSEAAAVDKVLDLSEYYEPPPEALDPLFEDVS